MLNRLTISALLKTAIALCGVAVVITAVAQRVGFLEPAAHREPRRRGDRGVSLSFHRIA